MTRTQNILLMQDPLITNRSEKNHSESSLFIRMCFLGLPRDRADKRRACQEIARRNWETRLFATFWRLNYHFRANFRQVPKDETVVPERYVVPLLQEGLQPKF